MTGPVGCGPVFWPVAAGLPYGENRREAQKLLLMRPSFRNSAAAPCPLHRGRSPTWRRMNGDLRGSVRRTTRRDRTGPSPVITCGLIAVGTRAAPMRALAPRAKMEHLSRFHSAGSDPGRKIEWGVSQCESNIRGQTRAGRYLSCLMIRFPDDKWYPITRPMTDREKTHYRERRRP